MIPGENLFIFMEGEKVAAFCEKNTIFLLDTSNTRMPKLIITFL